MDLMDWFAQFSQVGYDVARVCEFVPVTNYLKNYAPENQVSSVDSFLALGELCQNLIRVTKIIEKGGDSPIIQKVLDFGVFSNFRDKLETIKAKCVAMARNCLESLMPPVLPRLVTSLVLEKMVNDDYEHIGTRAKFEKYTEEEKTVLRNTFESLSSIYVTIRDLAKKCAFCSHDRHPAKRIFSFIIPSDPNQTEIEVKGRELTLRMVQFEPEEFWGI